MTDPWTSFDPAAPDVVGGAGDRDIDVLIIRKAYTLGLLEGVTTLDLALIGQEGSHTRSELLARASDALAEVGYTWVDGRLQK